MQGIGPLLRCTRGGTPQFIAVRAISTIHHKQTVVSRTPSRYYAPHQRSHGVHVGPGADIPFGRHLLVGRVTRRVRRARTAVPRQIVLLRRPEVDQHRMGRTAGDVVLPAYEDVPRLDVPMQDARSMHGSQPLQQRFHYREQVPFGERLPGLLPAPKKLQ